MECEPRIIRVEEIWEADDGGCISLNNVYNCECCDDKSCKFWTEWND